MPRMFGPQDGQQQWNATTDPLSPDVPDGSPLPLPYDQPAAQPRQRLISPAQQRGFPGANNAADQPYNGSAYPLAAVPGARRATSPLSSSRNGRSQVNNRAAPPLFFGQQARRRHWPLKRILGLGLISVLVLSIVLGILAFHRFDDFGRAISKQPTFSTQTAYMSGSDRVNLLVLGYGGTGHDGAYLSDSIEVISLMPGDHATTMISVPRDLWVQVPPNSGQYAKINTAYADGYTNGYNGLPAGKDAGGVEAAAKVSDVLGMPISYWMTMDFAGFRSLVDALGGIDINVPTGFTAQYPANDDPSINPNWKIIHFNAGLQHMNGAQAIEYARARYVLNPVSEGSDFARSIRQQLLIRAILSRARQVNAWPGLLNATNALQNALYTNLSLTDLALFSQKLDLSHAAHVGLTNQNVLVGTQSSDGQDILLPANGDWNAIRQYVTSNLKS